MPDCELVFPKSQEWSDTALKQPNDFPCSALAIKAGEARPRPLFSAIFDNHTGDRRNSALSFPEWRRCQRRLRRAWFQLGYRIPIEAPSIRLRMFSCGVLVQTRIAALGRLPAICAGAQNLAFTSENLVKCSECN